MHFDTSMFTCTILQIIIIMFADYEGINKLCWKKSCQDVKGGDPSPLPSNGGSTLEALCPVLAPHYKGDMNILERVQ